MKQAQTIKQDNGEEKKHNDIC